MLPELSRTGPQLSHAETNRRAIPFKVPGELQRLRPLTDWILQTRRLQDVLDRASCLNPSLSVFDRILKTLDVNIECSSTDLDRIPKTGPVLIVANHPHGLLDGLVLGSLLSRRRMDYRLLANSVLSDVSEVSEWFIPVDVFGGRPHTNGMAARSAIRWLRNGGVVVAFPAGEVSAPNGVPPHITDRAWSTGPLQLAQRVRAAVVHVSVAGQNSIGFQVAGVAHAGLRTLLLGRELLNKRGHTVSVAVGHPILPGGLERRDSEYLRRRTYLLRQRFGGQKDSHPRVRADQRLAPPQDKGALSRNIASLGAENLLCSAREFSVYTASASELPAVLPEIGRLREAAFRTAGEGTGRACDLDRFDDAYDHLFLWNQDKGEIAGAYRLGLAARVTTGCGPGGLYTHTLFRFGEDFVRRVSPGIELGRSFVRPEYQRSPLPLYFLWRGIGTYVARHPEVRHLFGPVSISSAYQDASRDLIVQYFHHHHRLPVAIYGRNPLRVPADAAVFRRFARDIADLTELGDVISDLELDGKGLPVLLRHYLNLGARVAGFNVDGSFADALDALIVVDLLHAPLRTLEKYMGRDGLGSWLGYHGQPSRRIRTGL